MTTPVRILDVPNLPVVSDLTNGLPVVRICGPNNWSSPYGALPRCREEAELKCALYRDMLNDRESRRGAWVRANIHTLRGRNVACSCPRGWACHGDVLIELANAPAESEAA